MLCFVLVNSIPLNLFMCLELVLDVVVVVVGNFLQLQTLFGLVLYVSHHQHPSSQVFKHSRFIARHAVFRLSVWITAIIVYTIRLNNLSANGQVFDGAQQAVSL